MDLLHVGLPTKAQHFTPAPNAQQIKAPAAQSSRYAAPSAPLAELPPPPARHGPARRTPAGPILATLPAEAAHCHLTAPPLLDEAALRRTLGEEQQLPLSLLRRLVYA